MSDAPGRWHWIALAGILGIGALLRFTALSEGIPFSLGIDEPEIMERAVRMMKTGDLHPHFFDYPGFYIYFQFLLACVRFIVGSIQGEWAHLDQAPVAEFYLWARAATAMFGTMTIGLVYLAGRRISPLAGLVSAAVFALQSLHVRESHFVLTDVPMTFFVTLTWVLTLRACERRDWKSCLWVGMAVGAAAATKYNGGVAILLPLLGLLLHSAPWRERLRGLVLMVVASGGTFLCLAPYTILALPEFLNAFAYLADMYADGAPRPEPAWLTYLKHLRNNFSIPGLVLAVAGVLLAVRAGWRSPRSSSGRTWVMAAGFAFVYFDMIAGQRLVWGRYLLPLLPFLSVLAGGAIAEIGRLTAGRWSALSRPAMTAFVLTAIVVAQPTMNAVSWLRTTLKTSTSEQAYEWLTANLPLGAKIATETREVLLPADRYTIVYPRRLIDHDPSHYIDDDVDYLIASSAAFRVAFYDNPPDTAALSAYSTLFRRNEQLVTFAPTNDHPGPEYRIFRVVKP
jgi:hypothetical protein